jgi:hypothetical protein
MPTQSDRKKNALFVTWDKDDPDGRKEAIETAYQGMAHARQTVVRSVASPLTYRDAGGPGVSARDGFGRGDYDWFRPGEKIPTADKDIQAACHRRRTTSSRWSATSST